MHLTNICWLKGCHWITVLWWQSLAVENSPSSYFPSSLCDGTPRKALTEQRTWCYESRGNSQAMVFCHLYKHRVFRKKKIMWRSNLCFPAGGGHRAGVAPRWFDSLVSPHPPHCCGLRSWQSDVTQGGKGSPRSQEQISAIPGQSQPPQPAEVSRAPRQASIRCWMLW